MPDNVLVEAPIWTDGIYQIETDDPVVGGPDGIANRQAKQLGDRTLYLKQQVENGADALAQHEASRNHPSASATNRGMVTLATVAEVQTGTDVAKAVTPAGVAAAVSGMASPAASETVAGKVELATNSETITGTDTVRAVHPAGVKAAMDAHAATNNHPSATTAAKGMVVLATVADVAAGTDGAKVVTPAALAATASTAIAGSTCKVRCSIASASASATVTFDEIALIPSLGGPSFKVSAPAGLTINLATTGAGGMDTGAAPISGFVSVYVIAKLDGTKALLACAATTSVNTVYGGANMPGGYTLSALIGIIPTNASSQFLPGLLLDRKWNYQTYKAIFTGAAGVQILTVQSLSGAIPAAARTVDIVLSSASNAAYFSVASDAAGTGGRAQNGGYTSGGPGYRALVPGGVGLAYSVGTFLDVPMVTAQTVYWSDYTQSSSDSMHVSGYEF